MRSQDVFPGLTKRAAHDPRAASLLALSRVIYARAESQAALDKQLAAAAHFMTPSDKALCTELFYGALRHHIRLNWFLRQKLPQPDKLPEELLLTLEQAVYELAHTRSPAYAVVNWAVSLTRSRFAPGLGRLVNGLLRDFTRRQQDEYNNPRFYTERLGPACDTDETAALYHAVPSWLVSLWKNAYGEEACLRLLEAGLRAAPQGVRLNAQAKNTDMPDAPAAPAVYEALKQGQFPAVPPSCWAVPAKAGLPLRLWQEQGLLSLQSAAAYESLFSLKPADWPQPLWDACAGRGGKSLALLEQGIRVHTATDPNAGRLQDLRKEFLRLKLDQEYALPRILPVVAEEAAFQTCFRSVLADVPCSGLGTLARHPEIRWRRGKDDIQRLLLLQKSILEAAHRALIQEKGSRILYLTCTLNPEENQEQLQEFLERHTQYELGICFQSRPDSPLREFFFAAELIIK